MADITVTQQDNDTYLVKVAEGKSKSTHHVELDDSYHQKLTGGSVSKEELIRRSFEFLLQREPKESILGRFHLSVISRYFPEYESRIKAK